MSNVRPPKNVNKISIAGTQYTVKITKNACPCTPKQMSISTAGTKKTKTLSQITMTSWPTANIAKVASLLIRKSKPAKGKLSAQNVYKH